MSAADVLRLTAARINALPEAMPDPGANCPHTFDEPGIDYKRIAERLAYQIVLAERICLRPGGALWAMEHMASKYRDRDAAVCAGLLRWADGEYERSRTETLPAARELGDAS